MKEKILKIIFVGLTLLLWGFSPVNAMDSAVNESDSYAVGATSFMAEDQGGGYDQAYWDLDIKKQTIPEIERNQRIDDAFRKAKAVKVVSHEPGSGMKEDVPVILTPSEIIKGILPKDLQEKKIDLHFDDTTLSDILMGMGESGHINIVIDPVLKNNKLDLHLTGVTIEETLLLVANTYDLGFKRVGDSLFVTKKDKLRSQNIASKIIKLKNISVEEAKVLIKDIVDNVNTSEEINSLIVVGEPEQIVRAQEIVDKIDRPQPQVIIEANIIEVNKDALKELGVDWSDQINLSYQENKRPVDFNDPESSPGRSAYEVFSMSRNALQFDTIIKMLEKQNKAKVLSNPRVSTLNNKEAEIFVGDRLPYTVTTISGGVATTDVRWEESGIRLRITPSIIGEDFVVLKVEPEVSYIFSFRGPADEYPWVKKREATAYVRVKNNQPFVLGGLLNQEDKKNLYKVPVFGDIPLIGNLFNYESHTMLDTELIISIIPKIVVGE